MPYALLAVFTVALLWPLFLGRTLYWGDLLLYFDPMQRYAQKTLQSGRIPLWNPYVLCGQPFLGNPQMSVFYPATALLPFVRVGLFLSATLASHLYLCGMFAYRFFSRWTLRRAPAVAGAMVYMGSACLVGRLQFPPMILTAAYFPLTLLCVDACIDRPRFFTTIAMSVSIGLMVLAGHPQVAYLILACGFCYALARLYARRQGNRTFSARHRHASWLALAAGLALGLLLASVQTLPSLQLLAESLREAMSASEANRFVVQAPHLLTLLLPRFVGHPASRDYWIGGNAWEPALFIGWLPLLFLGYAALRCRNDRTVRFWGIVALLGIWLSLGRDGGLYTLAFWIVPGVNKFHDPARFLFLTTFAFAALTAVAMDTWQMRAAWFSSGMARCALVLVALPLWWYGQDWNPTTLPSATWHRPSVLAWLPQEARGGRVYFPAHELFWSRFITDAYSDYGESDMRRVAAFLDTLLPNLTMRYGIEAASGYEPVPMEAPSALNGVLREAFKRGEPNLSRLAGLLDVATFALPASLHVTDARFETVTPQVANQQQELRLWENRDRLPRAWIVRRTRRVEGKMRIAAALTAPDFDPATTAILSAGRASVSELTPDVDGDRAGQATLIYHSPTRLRIHADAGAQSGFLVLSSAAYPGWQARVDGKKATLVRADGALMGVFLSAGVHEVELVYRPASYRIGLYLSLLAVGLLAGGSLISLRQRDNSP